MMDPNTVPYEVLSYIRFSSRRQATGDSRRRQVALALDYCKRRGWTLSDRNFEDLGVSAWRKSGKNNLNGNLGLFLRAVDSGSVKPGSVLIVESLDRISRQGIDEGYSVIKRILRAGVRIVTLAPEREFDVSATRSLTRGALEIQLILERAAEESELKSKRLRDAHEAKRQAVRAGMPQPPRKKDGRVTRSMTDTLPAWIIDVGGELKLHDERAAALRVIFRLAASGYGKARLIRKLDADGVRPFGKSGRWTKPYLAKILRDRRALGEYQPRDAEGKAAGDVLRAYYPAVVTEEEWNAARAGAADRTRHAGGKQTRWTEEEDKAVQAMSVHAAAKATGRTRSAVYLRRHTLGIADKQKRASKDNFCNPFSGLVRNARDPHDSYVVSSRGDPTGQMRILVNAGYAEGRVSHHSFPYATFERAVIGLLREINPKEILAGADSRPDPRDVIQGEILEVQAELAKVEAAVRSGGASALMAKVAGELEDKERNLESKLEKAKAHAALSASVAWEEFGTLAKAIDADPDARLRLRAVLRRMVERVWLLVVTRGHDRLAAVQIDFAGGGRRIYRLWHRPTRSNGKATVAGHWCAHSWTAAGLRAAGLPAQFDLSTKTPTVLGEDDQGNTAWVSGWEDAEHDLLATDPADLFSSAERHPLP